MLTENKINSIIGVYTTSRFEMLPAKYMLSCRKLPNEHDSLSQWGYFSGDGWDFRVDEWDLKSMMKS